MSNLKLNLSNERKLKILLISSFPLYSSGSTPWGHMEQAVPGFMLDYPLCLAATSNYN